MIRNFRLNGIARRECVRAPTQTTTATTIRLDAFRSCAVRLVARNRLVCRWNRNPSTGRLECRWSPEGRPAADIADKCRVPALNPRSGAAYALLSLHCAA